MRLIIDQNVPDGVVRFLIDRGHEITHVRDLALAESPDEVIAAIGDKNDAIVVTFDKDWRQIASKLPEGGRTRYRNLGRILFLCPYSQGLNRLTQLIDAIDWGFSQAQARADSRFIVVVGGSYIRFEF